MKEKKRKNGDHEIPHPYPTADWNQITPFIPSGEGDGTIANVDRHRARFSGGRLFLRNLTYEVQLEAVDGKLVLPHLRLEVLHDPPAWLPPKRRRRKRPSPIPSLTRRQYYQSRRFRERFRTMVEILAGSRQHMKLELIQDPEDAPLSWEGRCVSCGATLWVKGKWSDPDALPIFGGAAFMNDCASPDTAVLTRVVVPRKGVKSKFSWFKIPKIAPRKF